MVKKITLGQIITTEVDDAKGKPLPQIEVLVDGILTGYLGPRKGYFFQIMSNDGRSNLGRSINEQYHLTDYMEYPSKDEVVMLSFLITAIMEYASLLKEIYGSPEDGCDIVLDINYRDDEIERFVTLSREYVRVFK